MLSPECLTFERLQEGLVQSVRRRVNNGEYTERGLARMIGISQPHMHHVLKGLRSLTPEVGDALVACLGGSLLDLLDAAELGRALLDRTAEKRGVSHIPLLQGILGPGHVCPDARQIEDWLPAPWADRSPAARPAIMTLAPDSAVTHLFPRSTHALIDLDESVRVNPSDSRWYLLRIRNSGILRQVRRQGQKLRVLGQMVMGEEPETESLPLDGASVLQYVRGALLWIGPDPRKAFPMDYAGAWLPADRS
jgi:hypothetical protein